MKQLNTSTESCKSNETAGCLDIPFLELNGEWGLIHFILMTPESFKEMKPYAVRREPLACDINGSTLRTGF